MKKELRILVILIAVLLVGTVGYYFMPKKFGKNVNPSEVDHINVFDGNTGTGFTITDSEDIEYIVANIQGISMKRDGISLGRSGYSFKISYINSNDKDIIPVFILNSDNTICKDPFFCIFRKNCASVPEERSAIPLQTEQSSAGLLVAIIYSTIPARKFKTICLGCHSA